MINKYNDNITIQEPINSGFGPRTTAEEVVDGYDLSGKIAIVTGGYSGLGLEVSRVLAKNGATVIVPARTLNKAKEAVKDIKGIEIEELDLLDPVSIDAFAERFIKSKRPLHMLINAAGIMATPLVRDNRGFESQFATNHLGHFQLTARLWPALKEAKGARVVSVSSRGHRFSAIDFEDINFEKKDYDKFIAYGQSKTANSLFAVELDKRGKKYDIRAFAVHPGTIVTGLSRHLSDDEMRSFGALDEQGRRVMSERNDEKKSIEEGAATIAWCAVSSQLEGKGGVYCENVDIGKLLQFNSGGAEPGVNPWAVDIDAAEKLWEVSGKMLGIKDSVK